MKRKASDEDDRESSDSDEEYGPPRPSTDAATVNSSTTTHTNDENNRDENDDSDEDDYGPPRPPGPATIANNEKSDKNENNDDDEDDVIGPRPPMSAVSVAANDEHLAASSTTANNRRKKKQKIDFNSIYLDQLPTAHMYEWSYMHKDNLTHTLVTPHTHFVITASRDGEIKFWKKTIQHQLQFVKEYKAHTEPITSIACNSDGLLLCSCSPFDQTIKIFNVQTFDMINVLKFKSESEQQQDTDSATQKVAFKPHLVEFLSQKQGSAKRSLLAVCDTILNEIRIYDVSDGDADLESPLYCYSSLHGTGARILQMKYNESMKTMITMDKRGMIEYWDPFTGKTPTHGLQFKYKTETDLYDMAKNKTYAISLCISRDGKQFAALSRDRYVRIFDFATGKLKASLDETLNKIAEIQQAQIPEYMLENIDFGRRMAIEKELEKHMDLIFENTNHKLVMPMPNALFDDSGTFIIYPTLLGIKIVNIETQKVERLLGKVEHTERFMGISLFQGTMKVTRAELIKLGLLESNSKVENTDPSIFCCAYKKSRFYTFSRREPSDDESGLGRDIFNERPSKEDMEVAALNIPTSATGKGKLAKTATIHTTFGDIHIRLFAPQVPKAVENFTRLSQDGYYNGVIFHRVIRDFMIQTGDPEGDGTGGTSCWGRDFEDEFSPSLRHDAPFKVSMANAGPNTNGSQFFITTVATPWLDNKHTLFGEVVRGQDVVQMIEQVKTDRNEKPREEIKIINIDVQF